MMMLNTRSRFKDSAAAALACLFAALLCAQAYIAIPISIGPVPLVFGNFFVILGALLLGPFWGASASILYIVIGALGFPVFSGGRGGLVHLAGPTCGYLLGYVLGAFLAGLISRKRGLFVIALAAFIGFLTILVIGVAGLMLVTGLDLVKALAVGALPFIPGDLLKAVFTVIIASRLGPFVSRLRRGGFNA
jgi:biotin transport system substrate-specific component